MHHSAHPVISPTTGGPATARAALDALTVLAHDVRGPLASLALLVEAMSEAGAAAGEAATRIGRHAARAEQIIERLDGMLTGLLDRARRSGDALAPGDEPLDLADLVETVVALNRPLAEGRGVRLHCLVADPPHARGDAHLIMQALDNLLANAIGFTPKAGLVLCEAAPAENGDVLVRVTDEGPGLSPAEMARLFRPYPKVARPAPTTRRSTGLGLSIAHRIASAHGGSLTVESRGHGHGASFLLRLPAALSSA
jgi:signal transduction histidine kinase